MRAHQGDDRQDTCRHVPIATTDAIAHIETHTMRRERLHVSGVRLEQCAVSLFQCAAVHVCMCVCVCVTSGMSSILPLRPPSTVPAHYMLMMSKR